MSNNQDAIKEKANRIDMALKFTGGDMDKAKQMANGSMLDIIVIKGKFIVEDQNRSGAFLAYFNCIDEYVSAIKSVIEANDTIFTKIRIFDSWSIIYKNILAYKNGKDALSSEKLDEDLLNYFVKLDVLPHVKEEDINTLTLILSDILQETFDSLNINCQIELEKTNSIELELAGIDIMAPTATPPPIDEPKITEIAYDPNSPMWKEITLIESQAQFIVNGSLIISPVRGKFISEMEQDEKIYVLLTDKDPISKKVVDTYKARDREGNPLPVVGKVISIIPNEINKGYIIYVMIAKGIYAKIIEEENIRIQTESTIMDIKSDDIAAKKTKLAKIYNLAIYIVLILLIIVCFVIFLLL